MMKIKCKQKVNGQKQNNKTKRLAKEKYAKGITLISLVITIIILIILAGISINMVIGNNGLFTKAREAQAKFLNAQAEEEERLAELEKEIEDNENLPTNTSDTQAGTQVKLPSKWVTTIPAEYSAENGSKVKNEVRVANVRAIATGNGETVPVPKGFYYVGGTIESGVVISDNLNDQNKFVNAENGNVPAGVIYDTNGVPKTEDQLSEDDKKQVILGNQFVWIPVELKDYKKEKWTKDSGEEYKDKDAAYETQALTSELIQIKKYGGFYIGRYEAGTSNIKLSTNVNFEGESEVCFENDKFSIRDGLGNTATGNITCKAGEVPYYYADYFTASKLCNSMYKTDYVQSGLVTGTMWDVMLNFISEGKKAIVTTESYWGNYGLEDSEHVKYKAGQGRYAIVSKETNKGKNEAFTVADENYYYGIRTTASTEDAKKKNLYDVGGNLWEWTQEASYLKDGVESYSVRGGSFWNSYTPTYAVCFRIFRDGTVTAKDFGFRPALYIM